MKRRPRKLVLKCFLSPGDIVMLTAAVRDLHECYPGRFLTDVRTSCPELWEHNPHLTPLAEEDPDVRVLACHYPLIHRCNELPYHCLHGFVDFLNQRLQLNIRPTRFHGDVPLSAVEKQWFSQVHELTGQDTPFWIVVAGGKLDVTVKWWDIGRFQAVVDHFRGRLVFVQVGESGHYHPPLNGVIDLRGATDLRQLVRLVHHAQGVLCPVTALMHLAAAVETRSDHPAHRPCVVVAGGREPVHWEAYPHHQFIHTIGALPCCARGGCWKSRTRPVGDGAPQDSLAERCVDVVGDLPRCMHLISAAEVIRRIETYFDGGACLYLKPGQARAARRAIACASAQPRGARKLTEHNVRIVMERRLQHLGPYPGGFRGRGIVICGGGRRLFTNAYVCIRMLRRVGCRLPIELWHLGEAELDPVMARLVRPLGVRCIDAFRVRQDHPARRLGGWELKAYALLHCAFREALLLDADNLPVRNPESLFTTRPYRETGAVFWPDFERWEPSRPIWAMCGIPYRDEPEFESGQVLVDKRRCWRALQLAVWINEQSDFFYEHIYGDKDTFRLAFHKVRQPWAMPARPLVRLDGCMCQHDFAGRRMFQHRNFDKWELSGRNRAIPGFRYEAVCRGFIRELQASWDGRVGISAGEVTPWP